DGVGNITAAALAFLLGTSSADLINGTNAADFLYGFEGNDTLNGGAGIDTLIGGLGNDTYIIDSTTDTITEALGAGIDTVQSSVTYTLGINLDNLILTGTAALNGTGNTLNNVITGNTANNSLNGGSGNDTLIGGDGIDILKGGLGNDTYIVDSTTDTISEDLGAGIDTVQSSVTYTLDDNLDKLILTGTAAINGTGNALNNTLTGNTANNILIGRTGLDVVTGGAGSDTFSYAAGDALISGTTSLTFDRITDFVIGTDRLDGVNAVSASNLRKLGSVDNSLSSTTIESLLNPTNFTASGASVFTFAAGSALRTFLALNDANAGFQASRDDIIEITGYTGVLDNLAII
ncbi:MAG: bluetail domain-containing putative surface protein, partial [Synechococcaceae cyanobacterium]